VQSKVVVVLLVVGTSCHVTLYVQVFIVYLYPELLGLYWLWYRTYYSHSEVIHFRARYALETSTYSTDRSNNNVTLY